MLVQCYLRDDRQRPAGRFKGIKRGRQRRLQLQQVLAGLKYQAVSAAGQQAVNLGPEARNQSGERDVPEARQL